MNLKYIWLLFILLGLTACNDVEDILEENNVEIPTDEALPELNAGSADFSNYVSLGNSLTSGMTDGALFIAGQENSYPNLLSQQFALAGGGDFTQPWMSDNTGGILLGATQIAPNRLVTIGGPPLSLEDVIGSVTPTTNLLTNNPTGPFNNLGVPLAKAIHLLSPGYGDLNGLFVSPATANPFYVRMATSSTASVIGDAMAQSPSFFSLWIGANDVQGYAGTGGDGSNPITDQPTFDFAINTLISTLTSGGAQGVVANIPYVSDLPHYTAVGYNPVPLDAATAGALNAGYATYNGGLQYALANSLITAEEVAARTILFEESESNTMVLIDETLTDLSSFGIPSYRQSTSTDLFVLPLGSLIPAGYGTQIPLEDKWVLLPTEQDELTAATDAFNATIEAAATSAGLAFVDANAIFHEIATTGFATGNFILTSNLVTGGVLSLDGLHGTARGNALTANAFMKAIDVTYGSNFEASGNLLNVGDYPTNYSPSLQ